MRMMAIDTGYLSWIFAATSSVNFTELLAQIRLKERIPAFVFDSSKSVRKQEFPEYKKHREEELKQNPQRLLLKQRAEEFKRAFFEICSLHRFPVFQRFGYEADDLLAVGALLGEWNECIGVDKDLQQLPLALYSSSFELSTRTESFAKKYPKTLFEGGLQISPSLVPLILAVLGDSSDDVPRLLPRGIKALKQFRDLMNSKTVYSEVLQLFGEAFQRNLQLVLLPHFSLTTVSPQELVLRCDLWNQGKEKFWVEPNEINKTLTKR